MSIVLDYQKYITWSLSEKLYFFDNENEWLPIKDWNEKDIISFLKYFILNTHENKYIVQKSLSLFLNFALLGIISFRQTLNLLIDEVDDLDGTFIQLERLKSLLLFYEVEPQSIINIFESNIDNDDVEIKSECLYSLGVIYFFNANKEQEQGDFNNKIESCITYFRLSYHCTENRIDSLFFLLIAEVIKLGRYTLGFQYEKHLENITQLLWQYRLFSFDDELLYFKVKIYRLVYNLSYINKQNPLEWLQYKNEFNNICLSLYELKNCEIKNRLLQSSLIENLKNGLITNNIESYFKINFHVVKVKIEQYLALKETSENDSQMLNYILSLINDKDLLLEEKILSVKKTIQNTFPNVSAHRIDKYLNVDSNEKLQYATLKALEDFGNLSFEKLYDNLLASLIKLQGDITYRRKTEDERNTYIRNMLIMAGLNLKDQTFWGSSNTGISAGEIDLMVLDNKQLPFTIIEALILDSVKKEYIKLHIDKLYKYDTTGLSDNIIVVYSEAKIFSDFCNRYYTHICNYEYPYKQVSYNVIDSGYSEIKIYKTILDRNGTETNLYHFLLNLFS